MHRHILILISFLLLSVSVFAESNLPVVEIKADRTMIYPQRMELMGEETLMDVEKPRAFDPRGQATVPPENLLFLTPLKS